MRIALVSDIHGNDVALAAVLEDAGRVGADSIVCLGDVATLGPEPAAVVERVQGLGCLCVRGNHDDYLLDPDLIDDHTNTPLIREAISWSRDQLSDAHLDFIARFVDRADIPLGNGTTLTVFHGSLRSNTEDVLATTAPDELDRCLEGGEGAVLAGGHTHIQMVRQHRGRLVVNPGSAGMPFQEYVGGAEPTLMAGLAEYAVVEASQAGVSVTLRRVAVDPARACAPVRATDNPLGPVLLAQWGHRPGGPGQGPGDERTSRTVP